MSRGKRLVDLLVAIPGAMLLAAIAPLVLLANRLSGDRGPVLYRAERVGRGGVSFRIAKFRTMRSDSGGPGVTIRDDPRVTPVGRVLRRTKLDELPQVLNVIRGEMSIVGPRPEAPEYVDMSDPLHRLVFTALPGITGSAQLLYRHEEDEVSSEDEYRTLVLPRKLATDAEYLERATLLGDLQIILRTVRMILSSR